VRGKGGRKGGGGGKGGEMTQTMYTHMNIIKNLKLLILKDRTLK
jgi:GTPase involved in cell partitioning and DNA repair